jgi:thioesterase domain-containing protein/acyl carrier protein
LTSPDSHGTLSGNSGSSGGRGPLSTTEATVARIWSELLEQNDVGPDDDFFELGGDSLLAVWLMEEIAERTGTDLPLSLLLEDATIRHLANAVDAQGAQPGMWRGINVHGTRCPHFWIHGWAELLSTRSYFDADQPVFQIQDPLARRWQVKPTLELTARRYVEELRRIQREGPYQLIGYSFGGVIAYEMARQLLASGERVNFLGLLDTPAPGYVFPLPARLRMHTANAAQLSRMLAELRARSRLRGTYIRHTLTAITRHRWLRWLLKRLPHDWRVPTPPGSIARIHYRPSSYPGQIVLFWATEGWARRSRTPDLGWARLADGGLSVQAVPGNHRTMAYGPNARILARQVTECLSQACQPVSLASASRARSAGSVSPD